MAKRSKRFRWNLKDLGKGLLVAIAGGIVGGIQQALFNNGGLNSVTPELIRDWAVGSGIAYLSVNLFQDSNGNVGIKKEPIETDTDEILRHQ